MLRRRVQLVILMGATALVGGATALLQGQIGVPSTPRTEISETAARELLAEVRGLRADLDATARSNMRLQLVVARLQVESLRRTSPGQGRMAERQRVERDLITQLEELQRTFSLR
jgi:hypothetical protein